MAVAGLCVVLAVLWTLLVYVWAPLPLTHPLFGWLQRQWRPEGVALLTCLGAFSMALSQWRHRTLPRMPWWNAWVVWMLWVSLGVFYSIDRGVSARSWMAWTSYGLLACVAGALIRSRRDLAMWVRFLVAVAIAVSLEGVFQYVWSFEATNTVLHRLEDTGRLHIAGWTGSVIEDFLIRKRIFSVFGWPNLFAGFLLLVIPIAISVACDARRGWGRIGWIAASGLLGLSLVLTLSLGGWVAAILTACVSWWLLRRSRHQAAGSAARPARPLTRVLAWGLAVSAVLLITSAMVAKRAMPMLIGSMQSRVAYVRGAWNVLRAYPAQGTGIGTFGLSYQSFKPRERVEGYHAAIHAHNTVAQFAAELGLMGLAGFLLFLWRVARLIAEGTRSGEDRAGGTLEKGLAIGVLGFFIHSLLEQTFFEASTAPFWWLALGLLTGAGSLASPSNHAAPSHRADRVRVFVPLFGLAALCLVITSRLIVADAWAARGAWAELAGRSGEALHALEQADRWDPLTNRYAVEAGEYLTELSSGPPQSVARVRLEEAERQFERAVARSPWHGEAWVRLGLVSQQLGRQGKAIRAMREAAQRDPNSRVALVYLGRMLHAANRFDELQDVGKRLRQLEPQDPRGWFWEAVASQGLQQPGRATAAYRALVRMAPDHYPAWFNLGEVLREEGDSQGARDAYEAFLNAAPVEQEAARAAAQAYLEHGTGAREPVTVERRDSP